MLNLPIHKLATIDNFYKKIDPDFAECIYQKIQRSKIKNSVKSFLDKKVIQDLLNQTPDRLFEIQEGFIKSVHSKSTMSDYEEYLESKLKKNKTKRQRTLMHRFNPTNKKLAIIFNYDHYISSKKSRSYALSKIIGKNTCTYCNRMYTFTIVKKDVITRCENNSTRVARPQFDHWFPKKKFPLFALSFYNLIPSCAVCNTSVKSDDSFSLSTHLHPYIEEQDQKIRFSYEPNPKGTYEVKLITYGDKAERTIKDLKVREVYEEHSQYELKDIMDLRYKYSDNYLDVLFNDTFNLSEVDKKDAYRLLFGVEIEPKEFHKRPFSKFKYDILRELRIIR